MQNKSKAPNPKGWFKSGGVDLLVAIVGGVIVNEIYSRPYIVNWVSSAVTVGVVVIVVLAVFYIIRERFGGSNSKLWLFGILPFLIIVGGTLIYHHMIYPEPKAAQSESMTIRRLQPVVSITNVPSGEYVPGQTAEIGGEVRGLASSTESVNYCVVVYAYTVNPPGRDPWFVQPTPDLALTPIGTDGKWQTTTYLGSKYAAILVKKTYTPSPTLPALPVISGNIISIENIEGRKK